ncbi:MAG: hypothetical protein KAI34_07960 [Candidatus Lokiarchaeota archaeon]|nr:hypothetical protein [Candidatus Lokiarchaeota archaeon]
MRRKSTLTNLELELLEIITEYHEFGGIELGVIHDKLPDIDVDSLQESLDVLEMEGEIYVTRAGLYKLHHS